MNATMTLNELRAVRDRIEHDLTSCLSPDLRLHDGHRSYCVFSSEVGLASSGWFSGMSAPQMTDWFRAEIGDRFVGNGPTCLADDGNLFTQFHGPDDIATGLAGLMIHEHAHACDRLCFFTRHQTTTATQAGRDEMTGLAATEKQHPVTVSRRAAHEWNWIRICLHLHHRMTRIGWEIPLPFMIDREFYHYFSIADYRRRLGDEPARLADHPLTRLSQVPAPAAFLDFWQENIETVPDPSLN